MTLETYAYLGEIIAAVAVIASLIYVARQLGQTTAMMRVGAASERVQRDFEIVSSVIESREVADLWVKGGSQFDRLDEVDKQRLILFERRAITLWHHVFLLRQQSLYTDADWNENEWIIDHFGRRRALREAWRLFRDAYEKPFQEYIDGRFAIADSAAAGG